MPGHGQFRRIVADGLREEFAEAADGVEIIGDLAATRVGEVVVGVEHVGIVVPARDGLLDDGLVEADLRRSRLGVDIHRIVVGFAPFGLEVEAAGRCRVDRSRDVHRRRQILRLALVIQA